ncbi:MAG: YncE family protein [Deltaproteobacteria bacterium]|nr:YncE family protein [Deltaproteobacteria bacterium]
MTRNGVTVDFTLAPSGAPAGESQARLLEGDWAEVRFRIRDEATGQPVRGLKPAAWMDMGEVIEGKGGDRKDCREKIGLYLKGIVGIRPLIDLNAYYLLVMNQAPSISVIDPVVSMTGTTSLYAQVFLKRPGEDWVKSRNGRRLFVSMPLADEVAVVDTETFRLEASLPSGARPVRTAVQPDGRYLWVGNDAASAGASGVTVLDAEKLVRVKFLPTGRGHHEIAFSGDDRWAFVTNRDDGTVSVVDVRKLRKVKDLRTGPLPISAAHSPLSGAIYVADGREGSVAVIDPERLEVTARVALQPGLGPLRISPDGRWAFVVNTAENAVHVIDTTVNRALHTIPVPGKPYQVIFTRAFAYVRLLDSERVQMINLSLVGEGKAPGTQSFVAGNVAPRQAGTLAIADSIAPANLEAAVFVTNPGDSFTYYYMEGMNAPMGSFSGYGQRTRASTVVDRSVKEVEPGTYLARVRLPAAGRYDVALLLDSPRLLHCFSAEAGENPALHVGERPLRVEFLDPPAEAAAGGKVALRFKLVEARTGKVQAGVTDVAVLSFRAPGFDREQTAAREESPGVYQAQVALPAAGTYYAYVGAPSLGLRPEETPYRTIRATAPAAGGKDSHAARAP